MNKMTTYVPQAQKEFHQMPWFKQKNQGMMSKVNHNDTEEKIL